VKDKKDEFYAPEGYDELLKRMRKNIEIQI